MRHIQANTIKNHVEHDKEFVSNKEYFHKYAQSILCLITNLLALTSMQDNKVIASKTLSIIWVFEK